MLPIGCNSTPMMGLINNIIIFTEQILCQRVVLVFIPLGISQRVGRQSYQ